MKKLIYILLAIMLSCEPSNQDCNQNIFGADWWANGPAHYNFTVTDTVRIAYMGDTAYYSCTYEHSCQTIIMNGYYYSIHIISIDTIKLNDNYFIRQ